MLWKPDPVAMRRADAALVVSGVLMAAGALAVDVFDRQNKPERVDLTLVLIMAGTGLMLLGVAAIQRRHRDRSRVLGWSAVAILALGLLFGALARGYTIVGLPLSSSARTVGLAILREGMLRRLPASLLAVAIPMVGVIVLATADASTFDLRSSRMACSSHSGSCSSARSSGSIPGGT